MEKTIDIKIKKNRDIPVDVLRGIAVLIFTLSGIVGLQPKQNIFFIERIIVSTYAPFFMILFGFMLTYQFHEKTQPISYFIKRSIYFFMYAGFLDILLLESYPLIGIGMLAFFSLITMFVFYFLFPPEAFRILLSIVLLILTPILQSNLNYHSIDPTISLFKDGIFRIMEIDFIEILHRIFLDGWFPIFPWLSFVLFGTYLKKIRRLYWENNISNKKVLITYALFVLMVFGFFLIFMDDLNDIRGKRIELYFPPGIGLFLFYVPLFLVLGNFIHQNEKSIYLYFFRLFGESSMFVGVLYLLIFQKFLYPNFYDKNQALSFGVVILLSIGLIVFFSIICILIKIWKNKNPEIPYYLKIIIGG
jgi:uncharacterized membrane protein